MPVELQTDPTTRVLTVRVSGKLTSKDYEAFVPRVEQMIQEHGKIRVLLETHDFHGWNAGALWQDIKFDLKHFNDIGRLAIVGEKKWEHGMAVFCKPFTTAKTRFFEHEQADEARAWVAAD